MVIIVVHYSSKAPAARPHKSPQPPSLLDPPRPFPAPPPSPPPSAPPSGKTTGTLGRSLTTRHRDWTQSEVLAQRNTRYAAGIRRAQPHDPTRGMPGLVVRGEALEGQLEAMAFQSISIGEVEARMAQDDPRAFEDYMVGRGGRGLCV